MTTTSMPGRSGRKCRKLSLVSRLSRFRWEALGAAFLEIANPRRAKFSPFSRANTVKQRSLERYGFANTLWNPEEFSSLKRRGRANFRCEPPDTSLGAEADTTLGPAGLQDAATTLGCHAGTEAVVAFALEIAGLESSFHRSSANWYRKARKPDLKRGKIVLCRLHRRQP